jgi:hypothetical protein
MRTKSSNIHDDGSLLDEITCHTLDEITCHKIVLNMDLKKE